MEDGRVVAGESAVASDRSRVRRLRLEPSDPEVHPDTVAAIERADLIVLGPGSLFTSTLPPLLVPAIRDAVLASSARRVYVANLLQQPGETIGYNAGNHVDRLVQHVGPGIVDTVIVPHIRRLSTDLIPVEFDRTQLADRGVEVVAAHVTIGHHHDPVALARQLVRQARRPVVPARELLGGGARGARVGPAAGPRLLPPRAAVRPRPHRRLVPPARSRRGARRGRAAGRPPRPPRRRAAALAGRDVRDPHAPRAAVPERPARRDQLRRRPGDARGAARRRHPVRVVRADGTPAGAAAERAPTAAARTCAARSSPPAPSRRRAGRRTSRSARTTPTAAADLAGDRGARRHRAARARARDARGRLREADRDAWRTCSPTSAPARASSGWPRARSSRSRARDANRQANAETANIRRHVVAARRQLVAIGLLDLDALRPELARPPSLRLEHPELPLAELAALGDLSKATLAGRLRRIEALADDADADAPFAASSP